MATIRRLADSCLILATDRGATLFDPGFFTWGEVDLDGIGDVQRILITHEHADHVDPEFVAWLVDRGDDVTVHSNQAVADLLASHDIEVRTDELPGVTFEDVLHEPIPSGATPPNRSYTVDGVFTHPGDSQQVTTTAEVMALPLMAPWTSLTAAVGFAARVKPRLVIPIHDFFMSASGRQMVGGFAAGALAGHGIELARLDWGESITV